MQRAQITFDAEAAFGQALSGMDASLYRGYMLWMPHGVLAAVALAVCGTKYARETFAKERTLIERLGLLAK